jgi:hypothetical protein
VISLNDKRIPALLLLLVGLSIALYGGINWYDVGQESYEYEISEEIDIYEFSDLAASEQAIFVAAMNGTERTTTETLERLHEPDDPMTTSLVRYNGSYHTVETLPDDAGNASVSVVYQYDLDVVHAFSSLSETGQQAFQNAVANPDEAVTRTGALPPEFETGGDAADVGNGFYYVRYDGDSYSLAVRDAGPEGLTADLLSWWYRFVGLAGLLMLAVGAYSVRGDRIRLPVVTLVALGVLVGVPMLGGTNLRNLLVTGVASFVAGLATWNLLYWYDVGTDENGPPPAKEL